MNLNDVHKRIKAKDGAERTRSRHLNRIEKMALAVENRFPEVKHAQQIRLKHCSWLLEHWCKPSTVRDYRSSLRLLIEALDRDQDWFKPLGMAQASSGGRPRDVSVVRSRSSKYWMV
mgnify:FL=1|jgi:hypothetical protein|tara:strand:+ start:422 stop:772 length:351 start_codon:yes stop_codon:yes gene_type:complete